MPKAEPEKIKEQMRRFAKMKTTDYVQKLATAILMRAKGLDTAAYDPEVESEDPKTYEQMLKKCIKTMKARWLRERKAEEQTVTRKHQAQTAKEYEEKMQSGERDMKDWFDPSTMERIRKTKEGKTFIITNGDVKRLMKAGYSMAEIDVLKKVTLHRANEEAEGLTNLVEAERMSKKALPKERPFNTAAWAAYADKIYGQDQSKPTKEYLESIPTQTRKPRVGTSEKQCGDKKPITIYDRPPSNCALTDMLRKPMPEITMGKKEITCLQPMCNWSEKWFKITEHEVAILVSIKSSDMKKYGKYQCTNKIKEDMVGWVTIWQKLDEKAIKKDDKWKGREIMVLIDPKHDNTNILDFYAEASLSQKAAQKRWAGTRDVKMGKEMPEGDERVGIRIRK